jgi:phage tail sheath protein FI
MPGTYTYPGVYIEEIPSGVRTIVGVSISDTAFVDFFPRGPLDEAVRITSFGDFERVFGGVHPWSEASYAIQQFYLNGGQVAWVVRVEVGNPQTAQLTLKGGSPLQDTLTVKAKNPGKWGNNLQVAVVQPLGSTKFNLLVREVVTVGTRQQVVNSEAHLNLNMDKTDKRYAVNVVNDASNLVQLVDVSLGEMPLAVPPTDSGGARDSDFQRLIGGSDGDVRDTNGNLVDAAAFGNALRGNPTAKTGMYALDKIAPYIFNILCLPAAANLDATNMSSVYSDAEKYCLDKRAFLIVDIPSSEDTPKKMTDWMTKNDGLRHRNAAVYFPRLSIPDVVNEGRPRNVGPSGTLAGVYARIDSTRGVWKAPAGTEAALRGANLTIKLTDLENGGLNPLGINVLRNFPIFGNVGWGARTLEGADQQASEWKYIPVRRIALYIEESLYQGLKWVVFEPNDEPLWAQIRLNVGAFMHNLFRQGAFQGKTPREAYFVKCDSETTTQNDIDQGIVNILVGFAPLKPAEFVVIKIQQIAGQIQV